MDKSVGIVEHLSVHSIHTMNGGVVPMLVCCVSKLVLVDQKCPTGTKIGGQSCTPPQHYPRIGAEFYSGLALASPSLKVSVGMGQRNHGRLLSAVFPLLCGNK